MKNKRTSYSEEDGNYDRGYTNCNDCSDNRYGAVPENSEVGRILLHFIDVTFDQNGQNAVSAEFGILAASLPNWRFRTDKDVI